MKKKFLTGIKEIYEPDPTKVLGLDAYNDQEMKNVDKEVDNTELSTSLSTFFIS
jgi:hypothetical protein